MIRGILGVVPWNKAEVGRFYLSAGYGQGNWLFQCVQTGEKVDGELIRKALVYTIAGEPDLSVHYLYEQGPLVALYDVHVRVDPTSINIEETFGTKRFFVVEDIPLICASPASPQPWQFYGLNILTGKPIPGETNYNRVRFDRWSLVLDDDQGEELTIARFGYAEPL
jgi:hypothetical protein